MSTTTDTEEITDALEACDAVESVNSHADTAKIDVFVADDVRTTAPLTDVLDEYDLRIWYVNFDWQSVTLVPARQLDYPELGGEIG